MAAEHALSTETSHISPPGSNIKKKTGQDHAALVSFLIRGRSRQRARFNVPQREGMPPTEKEGIKWREKVVFCVIRNTSALYNSLLFFRVPNALIILSVAQNRVVFKMRRGKNKIAVKRFALMELL